jgi:hypothetical protein
VKPRGKRPTSRLTADERGFRDVDGGWIEWKWITHDHLRNGGRRRSISAGAWGLSSWKGLDPDGWLGLVPGGGSMPARSPLDVAYVRPVKPMDTIRHGTHAGYSHDKCRCDPCTQANREYMRAYRKQKASRARCNTD